MVTGGVACVTGPFSAARYGACGLVCYSFPLRALRPVLCPLALPWQVSVWLPVSGAFFILYIATVSRGVAKLCGFVHVGPFPL